MSREEMSGDVMSVRQNHTKTDHLTTNFQDGVNIINIIQKNAVPGKLTFRLNVGNLLPNGQIWSDFDLPYQLLIGRIKRTC